MANLRSERSILYNLSPIGIETVEVESLTSYIMRIAYEHNIMIGHLINKLIVPQVNKDYLTRSGSFGGNRFYECSKTINGYMENSCDLVKVLEILTSRSDLSSLTLCKWKDFIPLRNLLKDSLSWCPDCIQSWKTSMAVYYPLIWYIKPVKICIKHNRFLVEECSICNQRVDILRRQMIPGYCPNCGASLTVVTQKERPNSNEINWQTFVIQNIEDLLKIENNFQSNKNFRVEILNELNLILNERFSGNLYRFSHFLNIPKSTLRCWLLYENFPTLESLLFIFLKLNIKISDFLFEREKSDGNIFQIDNQLIVKKANKPRKQIDHVGIEKKLNELLTSTPAISMSAAAIVIGHDKRVLYRNFSDLCKKISQRYREHIEVRSKQRIEMSKIEIIKAFNSLINEGVYPSRRKMEQRLNKIGMLKEKNLQEYWKSLLQKSGFAK